MAETARPPERPAAVRVAEIAETVSLLTVESALDMRAAQDAGDLLGLYEAKGAMAAYREVARKLIALGRELVNAA